MKIQKETERWKCIVMGTVFVLLSPVLFAKSSSDLKPATSYGPQEKRLGIGAYLGDPMGLTIKGYVAPRLALDGVVGWSFANQGFSLSGDITYDIFEVPIHSKTITFPFYAGLGVGTTIHSENNNNRNLGAFRIPVGMAMQWTGHPIEVFGEVVPGIQFTPDSGFDLRGGAGIRFYFF